MREVLAHYKTTPEEGRLQCGWGVLELERTQELILRHLPRPNAGPTSRAASF